MQVKISAKSARQLFHGCDPEYIAAVCHAACCRTSSEPGGTLITIHPSEEIGIILRGGKVANGMLESVNRRCPFQHGETHLCGLHGTDDKPFGCISSPFTLNKNNTLIIRNRYRLLRCYGAGQPAYRAFGASLRLLFGDDNAAAITRHLDADGGDLMVDMDGRIAAMLADNDAAKRAVHDDLLDKTRTSPYSPSNGKQAEIHDGK